MAEGKLSLQAFVEADFFSDGSRFRLRHAYITAGDFIIGQTWTTLSFLESMAFMIDFAAGDALFGGRSVQIRYQKKLNKGYKLSIGLEYLSSLGIENSFDLDGQANIQLPLLALRLDKRWKTGVLFLGASVAQLLWDGGSTGPSDQIPQLSFVVAGSNANAVLNQNGELESIQGLSAMLGYMHRWAPKWESNFNYAYGWLDAPDSREPFVLKRGGIGHLNLIHKFDRNFSIGIEYMWGANVHRMMLLEALTGFRRWRN